jgi:Spy/CpxP family protein refolding chaperone
MRKTRILIGVVIGALALSATAAVAQPGRMGPGRKGGHRMGPDRIYQQLDLTEQQQEKIQALRLETAKKAAQIQADLKVARLELRSAMAKDVPSASEVKAKVEAVNRARGEMLENRVNTQLAVRKLLTPQQRDKMKTLRRQGPAGRRGGWEGRRGPGPWPGPRGATPQQPGS